jgi:hypothetical protein
MGFYDIIVEGFGLMNAAAFSAIITDITATSPPGIFGTTEASATRRPEVNKIKSTKNIISILLVALADILLN